MPYAMLFNQNMESYEFIDKRNQPKDLSFSIQKPSFKPMKNKADSPNFYMFSYVLRTQYDQVKNKFMQEEKYFIVAYVMVNNKIVAGIPVSRTLNGWKI